MSCMDGVFGKDNVLDEFPGNRDRAAAAPGVRYLIWVDDAYGLISWKMDLEIGRSVDTTFGNPDFVAYAESFGATGYRISSADELLPVKHRAGSRHGVGDCLPPRLLRQPRAHRVAWRPGRLTVLSLRQEAPRGLMVPVR